MWQGTDPYFLTFCYHHHPRHTPLIHYTSFNTLFGFFVAHLFLLFRTPSLHTIAIKTFIKMELKYSFSPWPPGRVIARGHSPRDDVLPVEYCARLGLSHRTALFWPKDLHLLRHARWPRGLQILLWFIRVINYLSTIKVYPWTPGWVIAQGHSPRDDIPAPESPASCLLSKGSFCDRSHEPYVS